MANTYVMLCRFTEKGIENIKESPGRVDAVKEAFKTLGGEVREFCLTLGRYDTVIIADAPDDETIAKLSLAICSLGNVQIETLRGFKESDFRKIIGSLPTIRAA